MKSAGYDPVISEDIIGNPRKTVLFTFDSKLIWNEDIQNNIDNSKFYENFREWLEKITETKSIPILRGVYEIGATTVGIYLQQMQMKRFTVSNAI